MHRDAGVEREHELRYIILYVVMGLLRTDIQKFSIILYPGFDSFLFHVSSSIMI